MTMKLPSNLLRFLWIGCIGAIGILFWRSNGTHEPASPAPAKPRVSSRAQDPIQAQSAIPSQPTSPRTIPARADPPAAAPHASIHLKLRQLFETKTGDTATQEQLLKELVAMLTDENVAAVMRSLTAEELLTPFGTAALDRWLSLDLAGAANWIAARADATDEHALVVAKKMLAEPTALHAYCDQLPDGKWKDTVLSSAGLTILSNDPAEAIKLARQMTPGAAQTDLLQTVTYDWTHREPDAALAWILKVPDASLRESLFAVGAKAIAVTDPDLAAGWLVAAVKTEGVSSDAALSIVETWVAQDPAKAASWAAQFPERGPREAALETISRRWLQSDPTAATAWIQSLPERDRILAKLKAEQEERDREPEP